MYGIQMIGGISVLPLLAAGLPTAQVAHADKVAVDLNAFRFVSNTDYVNSLAVTTENLTVAAYEGDYTETAARLVQEIAPGATFRLVDDHYIGDNGIAHVYFRQTVHDIDIDNADFNVNIGKDGKVFSFGNSFFTGVLPQTNPLGDHKFSAPVAALRGAKDALRLPVAISNVSTEATDEQNSYVFRDTSGAVSDPMAKLVYFVKPDGSLALTWRIETDVDEHWFLTYIDAETTSEVHGVIDYVAEATYQVYPWGVTDPTDGNRTIITDPWDLATSQFTWIGDGWRQYTTTKGNNAIAQWNPSGGSSYLFNYRPSDAKLNFQWPYSINMTQPSSYINASIVQLFYTVNTYHDLLYTLGFTETAGNFEYNNGNHGGRGRDYVILNAQDGSGVNNANFATPPDGIPGRMRMYIWTEANWPRDGSFEAAIVIHEYTHGLSTRLTGGPYNSGCLNSMESGGMGEGWGDFMGLAIRLKPDDTRETSYTVGAWSANDDDGVRLYPYSTSLTENPLTYSTVNYLDGVHDIGTVWATMLYEVMWNLIDKHGKNDGPKPELRNGVPTDGKYLSMKLVMDGMALQPCNPNFIQARDAILDADVALTGGKNKCEIWTGFAKRRLGFGAVYHRSRRIGSTDIPVGVC